MTEVLQWNEMNQAIQEATSIVVVSHLSPDGDAVGSLLSMAHVLLAMNKRVEYAIDGGPLDMTYFLDGNTYIQPALESGDWDLVIAVDCGDAGRAGDVGRYAMEHARTSINIDHHPSNTLFGDVNIVKSSAVSTTQIIFEWLEQIKHPISQVTAQCLLTGLLTDTLGLRTSNVTGETLAIVQKLVEAGAELSKIMTLALERMPYSTFVLWKYAFASAILDDQVMVAQITLQDAADAGLEEASDGGFVSLLNQIEEAQIAVVFKEKELNKISISMRAKLGFNVAKVAVAIGGGGHIQASGALLEGTMEEVRGRVMPLLHQAVADGKPEIV